MPSISGRSRSRTTTYHTISFDDGPIFQCDSQISDLLLTKMNIIRIISTGFALITFIASLIENSFILQHKCDSYICWKDIAYFYITSPIFAFLYFLLFSIFFDSDYKMPQCITKRGKKLNCFFCVSRNGSWDIFKYIWNLFWESLSCTFIVVFCTFCIWYFGFSWHFILIWMNFQLILRGYDADTINLYKFIYFECRADSKEKLIRCIVIHRYLFDLYEHSHEMIEKKYFKMDQFQEKLKTKIY
eukprot:444916_1